MKLRTALAAGAALIMATACVNAEADPERPPKHHGPSAEAVAAYEFVVAGELNAAYDTYLNGIQYDQAVRFALYVPPPKPPVAPARRSSPAPASRPAGGATGSCGGATNGADRFIARESGGNPNARNPSGAWGCYQIMPATWAGSCSDLGQHGSASVSAQAACASRLPSSAWAASGG